MIHLKRFQIDGNDELDTLKVILEAETGIDAKSQLLIYNGNALSTNASLTSLGIQAGDLLMLQLITPNPNARPPPSTAASNPYRVGFNLDGSSQDPALVISKLRNFPPDQLSHLPPEIIKAAKDNNITAFQDALRSMHSARQDAIQEQRLVRLAAEDPLNPEVQLHLEETIKAKNIIENYETALETSPELFGDVVMLYVDMEVNGVPCKAFVDSGAQITIMSKSVGTR